MMFIAYFPMFLASLIQIRAGLDVSDWISFNYFLALIVLVVLLIYPILF